MAQGAGFATAAIPSKNLPPKALMARDVGLPVSMLSRRLQGRGRPTFDDLYRLLAVARARYGAIPEAHEAGREVLKLEPPNLASGGRFNPSTTEYLAVSNGLPGLS